MEKTTKRTRAREMAKLGREGMEERFGSKAPPLGMRPDGTLNIVHEDDPPFEPLIVDDDYFDKTAAG